MWRFEEGDRRGGSQWPCQASDFSANQPQSEEGRGDAGHHEKELAGFFMVVEGPPGHHAFDCLLFSFARRRRRP